MFVSLQFYLKTFFYSVQKLHKQFNEEITRESEQLSIYSKLCPHHEFIQIACHLCV